MTNRTLSGGKRVLILAPVGRDAESLAAVLDRHSVAVEIVCGLNALAENIGNDVGAALITEEALIRTDTTPLTAALERQPAWSNLPFIFLASPRYGGPGRPGATLRLPERITNVITLERPIGKESLLSAVDWALAGRNRQFELRDRWQELEDSEKRLRDMADAMPQLVWTANADGTVDYYNDRRSEYLGLEQSQPRVWTWRPIIHDDDLQHTLAVWSNALATGQSYTCEHRLRLSNGEWAWHVSRAECVRDSSGRIAKWYGTATNIEELKRAQQALVALNAGLEAKVQQRTAALEAAMLQRQRTEEALRQAQKMEAVGQLTGGIAHDFNNMLTGIIGSLELMKRRMESGNTNEFPRYIEAASVSAQRAASLTHRLLAFSRRQSLDDKPIDVNSLVGSLEDFLRRTIGENIDLSMRLARSLTAARADSSQLESALVNLVINARDAMPDGGRLTIETSEVKLGRKDIQVQPGMQPGQFVSIMVTDSGVGMSPEVLAKAFDPFFTTKPIGQGTGLGLSMVYGFAQQSGGMVRIGSQPGKGTAVEILLPVADAPARAAEEHKAHAPDGKGETVLVVEDEPAVRMLVREVLDELGYASEEAKDGYAALEILRSQRRIDLMVSDVGLPGMNGRQLAELARETRPDLRVLFVTGYAEHAAARSNFLAPGMDLIAKPFAFESLAVKIREMLA